MHTTSNRVYFIDLDGVLVEQGTHNLIPGALDALKAITAKGHVWFFSCWAFNPSDIAFLRGLGIPVGGIIPKPNADEYVYIDDKLIVPECGIALAGRDES